MKSGLEGTYATVHRTKRQQEVLERLEAGHSVKQISTDLGVTRNAVYQTIDRLRRHGALPPDFTASGQLPPGRIELLAAAPGGASRLAELRELEDDAEGAGRYAELVEAAIADGDVAALAYELGRLDAGGRGEVSPRLIEAALRRLGILPQEGAPEAESAQTPAGQSG
jgi:transposase-like protein